MGRMGPLERAIHEAEQEEKDAIREQLRRTHNLKRGKIHGHELRPRAKVHCPMRDQNGCDWTQVISWFYDGPAKWIDVPSDVRQTDCEDHLQQHLGPRKTWFS